MKPPFLSVLAALFLPCVALASAAPGPIFDGPTLPLDEVGTYRVGYRLRGEADTALPMGWTGGLDSPNGAACEASGIQQGKETWLLHCPWKGKTGVTFQEFTLDLPRSGVVRLRGATALREASIGKSDGVVCRVLVNGEKRYETNRHDADWLPFDVDLTAEAGQSITVRFETDPGPRDDSSFDFSLWADRRIEVPGFAPAIAVRAVSPSPDLRQLASRQEGGVVPPTGFAGQTSVRADDAEAVLRYEGADGALEYHWQPGADSSLLGRVALRSTPVGGEPSEVPLAGSARLEWTAPGTMTFSRLAGLRARPGQPDRAVLTRTYAVAGQTASLTTTATLQGKSLVFDVACDQPVVRVFEGGAWGPAPRRRLVKVPFYSAPIQFLVSKNLFAGAFLDWTISQASSQAGTRAVYEPRTDGSRNLLRERLVYTAASQLDETLPNIPNPPSPYRADLAGQLMLDVWGGSYASIQKTLHALAAGGWCGPATVLLHEWQFGGYDNMLPQHVPALATLGGDPALAELVKSAAADGFRIALHENYVDYYPNFPGFDEADIALAPDRTRVKAWFHPGTKIQSSAVKPTRILPLAKTQGPEVLRRYGTTACYLDVHSAVPPWFHVDAEATQAGAGEFRPVWDAHRDLWAYERELHHGPVFGEGNDHWYWSGLLDGVEAQFGQGWPDGQGTSAPLFVDFDLLKIHPLQLNHGMGYYDRWWGEHGPDADHSLLALLDRYRMQEAAYGHQGFLGGEAWKDPGITWLESHLLPPLTERTALASPLAIDYAAENGRWLDASATVRARGNFSQVRVRYDNGVTVWANGGESPLTVDDATIPPDGWLARGQNGTASFTAGTTVREGVRSDFAETPDSVFANARAAVDWQERGRTRIRPAVTDFTATGPRSFRAAYGWKVGQTLKEDLTGFVHFVPVGADPSKEMIRFQQDHRLSTPTSQWQPGQTVADGPWDVILPADLAPGDYQWTVGLYGPNSGRLALQGRSDPHNRTVLGTLHVTADTPLTFTVEPAGSPSDASLNVDVKVLDFGSIRTDGSVSLRREGADWVLRSFPADRAFSVELSAARFGAPPDVQPENGWWRLPLTGEATYRWPALK